MSNALFSVFGEINLSDSAKTLFIFLLGFKQLTGKLPNPDKVPVIGSGDIIEVFVELTEAGYILGSPRNYELNLKKLKLQNFSTKIREPSVLELVQSFREHHQKYRKSKPINGEKDLIQLRFLIRNFSGVTVKELIQPFFVHIHEKKTVGPTSISHFFPFALKRLEKTTGKVQKLTSELGAVKKKSIRPIL